MTSFPCRAVTVGAGLAVALALCGCSTLPRAVPGRPAEPLESGRVEALRPRGGGFGLELAEVEVCDAWRRCEFGFWTYCEVAGDLRWVTGDCYLASQPSAAPLVVLSPILAGTVNDYLATRYFAEAAAESGLHAFFLHQEEVILDGRRDAFDLEARIRQSLRDTLAALDLLVARPEVDATRLGSIGISFGAIKNVLLVAVEPRLRANAFAMAGADLARIVLESRETLVLEYLRARRERDGLEPAAVAAEIGRWYRSRPGEFARSVENDRVLMLLGRLDDKVPYAAGLVLRERLGEPKTHLFPLGHYTAALIAPWAASVACDWIRARLGAL